MDALKHEIWKEFKNLQRLEEFFEEEIENGGQELLEMVHDLTESLEEFLYEKMEDFAKEKKIKLPKICECGNTIKNESHEICIDCWKGKK